MTGWEVVAVRYATRTTRAREVYLNHHVYGEPDRDVQMDYFFWVVRNDERTVLIDTGFTPEVGRSRGRTMTCPVPEALQRLHVDPAEVDTVVITHAHYDHTGNLGLFDRAQVVISGRELDFWTGAYAHRVQFAHSAHWPDVELLADLDRAGRVTRVDGRHRLTDGIELMVVGGHTPGQLIVRVSTDWGSALLASDAVHYYDELDDDRPFVVVADLEQMYRGFDTVAEIAAEPGVALVAGHDPLVLSRFPAVDPADPSFAVRVDAGEEPS